jgi:hypothetical protein
MAVEDKEAKVADCQRSATRPKAKLAEARQVFDAVLNGKIKIGKG